MGLILGGILAGAGTGVSGAADMMERERIAAEERAARAEAARLEREARAEDRRLDRELRAGINTENADLRRELAAARAAPRSAGGGAAGGASSASARDMVEGSAGEEALAAQLGMSVPEFRRFRAAERTGDYEGAYGQERVVDDESGGHTARALPEGFKTWLAAKRKEFADASRLYVFGKDAKEVEQARGEQMENDVRAEIAGAQDDGGLISGGRRLNAMAGKGEYEGGATGSTNTFTGAQTLNQLGKAKVGTEGTAQQENRAQAGAAAASGRAADALAAKRRAGGDDGEMTNDQLNRAIDSARKELATAENLAKDAFGADKDEKRAQAAEVRARLRRLQALQDDRTGGKTPAPASPAAKTIDALPKGAKVIGTSNGKKVYETPDGKRFIEK